MNFHLAHRQVGSQTVVTIHGEIDVYTAPSLREKLFELITAGETNLVVDLSHVEFLDSTGLGVLVGALKRVRSADGQLALVTPPDHIFEVFRLTGLTKVFAITSSLDDALVDV